VSATADRAPRPATPGGRLRRALPWLAAAAVFAWLLHRVPVDEVGAALRHGSYLPLAFYVLLEFILTLPTDAFATREALAVAGVRRSFGELLRARAATYLLSLLSYFASLGGIGWWVARGGERAARATGAVLLMLVANGIALVLIACAGLLIDLPPELSPDRRQLLVLLIAGALGGIGAYLGVIAAKVRWLAGRSALAPLFEAGLAGHAQAVAARLPHMLLLALLHWGAFRIWGIDIPFLRGLALMPVVLLITALPITPSGLGTTQVLQVLFFSAWADGATPEARGADVLAFSLVHWVFSLVWQGAIGLVGLRLLQRQDRAS
ncbi:MAG TPA: lysylphosphatidylglycerol synthase domain-containing protein, partial [Thermoanaerobaculia bacterium]|nr:lysylphosphatidylglycerol synthase domain-containing protein [Thermoanaerobaculia bacterium]